jgi:single-stranded-DNA-specific exonuclease
MTKDIKDTGYAKTLGSEEEHLRLFVKQSNSDGIVCNWLWTRKKTKYSTKSESVSAGLFFS